MKNFRVNSIRNVAYFLLFFTFFLSGCGEKSVKVGNYVKIDDTFFSLEIADTKEKRKKGLMHRDFLEQNHGMLFVFEETDLHTFWMKNTLIPLKIIWIAEDLQVVDIQNAYPCKKAPCRVYEPKAKAKFVLEVNVTALENLKVGDSIEYFFKNGVS